MGKISDLMGSCEILSDSNPEAELVLIKSDFKAAYRSCPIRGEHLPLTRILVWDPQGKRYRETSHRAMPFGSIAAVYAWDRLGAAISTIIARALLIPCCRYVDDLFAGIYKEGSDRARAMMLRLVDLLGFTLERDKTPEPSAKQTILGVQVEITRSFRRGQWHYHALVSVDPDKAEHWVAQLSDIERRNRITPNEASKFAGRFTFLAHAILGPMGSSKIRHLYRAAYRTAGSRITGTLRSEIDWWKRYLLDRSPISLKIRPRQRFVPIIYTDATGGGGLGIVIVTEQGTFWTKRSVSEGKRYELAERRTQIIAFEMLAALEGLRRFSHQISNRDCVLFVDNLSARGSLAKGKCKKDDLQIIVDDFVSLCTSCKIRPRILWIPSSLNISDLPSRGKDPTVGKRVSDRKVCVRSDWYPRSFVCLS